MTQPIERKYPDRPRYLRWSSSWGRRTDRLSYEWQASDKESMAMKRLFQEGREVREAQTEIRYSSWETRVEPRMIYVYTEAFYNKALSVLVVDCWTATNKYAHGDHSSHDKRFPKWRILESPASRGEAIRRIVKIADEYWADVESLIPDQVADAVG